MDQPPQVELAHPKRPQLDSHRYQQFWQPPGRALEELVRQGWNVRRINHLIRQLIKTLQIRLGRLVDIVLVHMTAPF